MQAGLPPVFSVQPQLEETIAAGEQPDWLLVRRDAALLLRRSGLDDLRATLLATRDTPRGRAMVAAVAGGGALTLHTIPGVCRTALLGETYDVAALTLPDGTVLRGCAVSDGQSRSGDSQEGSRYGR